jgi:hypothetical protein
VSVGRKYRTWLTLAASIATISGRADAYRAAALRRGRKEAGAGLGVPDGLGLGLLAHHITLNNGVAWAYNKAVRLHLVLATAVGLHHARIPVLRRAGAGVGAADERRMLLGRASASVGVTHVESVGLALAALGLRRAGNGVRAAETTCIGLR